MVKERPEEVRNSLRGNFYSFLSLLWGSFGGFGGLWLSFIFCFLFSFLFSLFFLLKFQN
ncbi:putative membrane protein [Helicobacter pylori Hp H-16]|nr:putative membrane protein [Helicobacter pylori Hp H-16]